MTTKKMTDLEAYEKALLAQLAERRHQLRDWCYVGGKIIRRDGTSATMEDQVDGDVDDR